MKIEDLIVLMENMRKITTTAELMKLIPESTEVSGLTVSSIGMTLLECCDEINDLIYEIKEKSGWKQDS